MLNYNIKINIIIIIIFNLFYDNFKIIIINRLKYKNKTIKKI